MYRSTRQATKRLLSLLDEGVLDKDQVILACINYMSEADVADMCNANVFFENEEDVVCFHDIVKVLHKKVTLHYSV